jgi:hypothetical protein
MEPSHRIHREPNHRTIMISLQITISQSQTKNHALPSRPLRRCNPGVFLCSLPSINTHSLPLPSLYSTGHADRHRASASHHEAQTRASALCHRTTIQLHTASPST